MVLKTSVLYDTEQLRQSMLCQCNCFFYPIIFFKTSPTVQGSSRARQSDVWSSLFESESMKMPGFVEFDGVNGKLTYSAHDMYAESTLVMAKTY
jgi:hypothetical protein